MVPRKEVLQQESRLEMRTVPIVSHNTGQFGLRRPHLSRSHPQTRLPHPQQSSHMAISLVACTTTVTYSLALLLSACRVPNVGAILLLGNSHHGFWHLYSQIEFLLLFALLGGKKKVWSWHECSCRSLSGIKMEGSGEALVGRLKGLKGPGTRSDWLN